MAKPEASRRVETLSLGNVLALALSAIALTGVGSGKASVESNPVRSGHMETGLIKTGNKVLSPEEAKKRKIGSGVHFNCLSLTHEQRTVVFEDLKNSGIGWVRMNLNWNDLEHEQGQYDPMVLANIDDCVAQANQHLVNPMIVFQGSPTWANGGQNWNYPPSDPANYAKAVGYLAGRYNGSNKRLGTVKAFEIWNEPNSQDFWMGTTEQLVALNNKAYSAIKAVNPKTYVVLAPTINNDPYLERLILGGAKFDVAAVHLYPDTSSGDADKIANDLTVDLRSLVAVLKRHNVKAPLWITEFGVARSSTISPDEQAVLAESIINTIKRFKAIKMAVYFQAQPSGSSDPWEYGLGSIDSDGSPWPVLNVIGSLSNPNGHTLNQAR